MNCCPSISQFDVFERDEVLELLVGCLAQLHSTQKKVLAMYYHEKLELAEIAACFDLTACEIGKIRAETVELLRTMLATQIGLPERHGAFDNVVQVPSQGSRQPLTA
jgi:DNA-directed RNA polymerase specialized sigma subunit